MCVCVLACTYFANDEAVAELCGAGSQRVTPRMQGRAQLTLGHSRRYSHTDGPVCECGREGGREGGTPGRRIDRQTDR